MKNVRWFRHINYSYVTLIVCLFQSLIIFAQDHFRATQFFRRISTEVFHHRFDFFSTALARFHYVYSKLFRESIFYVDIEQQLIQRFAIIFCPCSNFSNQTASRYSIFITNKIFSKESVAFFTTTDIFLFTFTQTDLTGNPLKSGVAVKHFDVILISDFLDKFGSNDCLYTELITFNLTQLFVLSHDIIKVHHTSLITVNQYPFTLVILTSDTHTVSIRIGSHYEVSINFFGKIYSHRKSLRIFRIRRYNSREVTVLNHLFGHSEYIFESPHLQCTRNQHHTCTVNRSIDNLHIFVTGDSCRINRNGFHHVQINLINVFTDNLNQIRISLEFNISSRSNGIHFINDTLIMRSQHLCTIIPICLITVVFFRIVRSSQNDTTLATEVTDSKRHFRSRTHIIKQIYFNAIGRENISRSLCKQTAVVTTVVTYYYRNLRQILEVLLQIIGKPLSGSTYCINVHTVATYPHDTAQTACTKFQILIESFN